MQYQTTREFALQCDESDPLAWCRENFVIPPGPSGDPSRYFCGNSLGLMPRDARVYLEKELEVWGTQAVLGHHETETPWYSYHELFRGSLARLVGAKESEVVLMNSLTVNLHLFMVSFYRPTSTRFKILVEDQVFPSDLYALKTQIAHHGLNPDQALLHAAPRPGEALLRTEDVETLLETEGESIALVMMGGVNFLSGQFYDMKRITGAAKKAGCRVGFDLAHAAGNVPLALHDWGVDFAVWCSYKYLNGGPGALGGGYVHESHASDPSLHRFGGWWGNNPETRFRMQLEDEFVPVASVDGWQLSNPSIFSMAPLRASMDLFDKAGLGPIRKKSLLLTGYLEYLLKETVGDSVEIVTPTDPAARGCQLSLTVKTGIQGLQQQLTREGFICDFRKPNILRIAPTPLYNTFMDVWELATTLATRGRD